MKSAQERGREVTGRAMYRAHLDWLKRDEPRKLLRPAWCNLAEREREYYRCQADAAIAALLEHQCLMPVETSQ